jgi:YD repeat-containing protein
MRTALILVLVLGACGEGDGPPDRLLPGPCSAEWTQYAYDASDRLETFVFDAQQGVELADSTWTWTDAGTLSEIDARSSCDLCETKHSVWAFADDAVTRQQEIDGEPRTEVYEPDLRFLGDRFEVSALRELEAPDSLLQRTVDGQPAIDYSYSGPPRQGTRTRTGSDGSVETFTYDDDGLLTRWVRATGTSTFRYEDGMLVEYGSMTLEHDSFGNLIRTERGGNVTTYDYGCW